MKNITLQLFEYLLAASHSRLSAHYHLNDYVAYWFLDEILSTDHVEIENVGENKTCIKLYRSHVNDQEVEVSLLLATVLKLLQYDRDQDASALISKDELEQTLLTEAEAIKKKIEDESRDAIIINDWQQLLLGVDRAQIPMQLAIQRRERLVFFTQQVLKEYEAWTDNMAHQKMKQAHILKVQALYDHLLKLSNETSAKSQLNLGIGILHLPDAPSIYHPLLTLSIEVVIDKSKEMCQLIFEDRSLTVDEILNQILFHDLDFAQRLRLNINEMKVSPFDDRLIAAILQKTVQYLHPEGRYFASPIDAAQAPEGVPLVLHRAVLFTREEEQSFDDASKLKLMTDYLSNNNAPSDVIGSIGDPNYASRAKPPSTYSVGELHAPALVWSTEDVEKQILSLLDHHHAVAVLEEEKGDKHAVVVNLITHFMTTGKRVLIVGEDDDELTQIQEAMPAYLNGLHTKLHAPNMRHQTLKTDLMHLLDKNNQNTEAPVTNQTNDEIGKVKAQLDELTRKIVDYRELGSKKVFWKDKRYYPYELAQLISKLGGKDYLDGDILPVDTRFHVNDLEIEKIWDMRADFTPEAMSLLHYDFIDIQELTHHHDYQKMLASEESYLRLSAENPHLEEMFDQTTDIRFIQYLFDHLPKLMNDVSEIKTANGEKILKKALTDLATYHALTSTLGQVAHGIKGLELARVGSEEKKIRMQQLNEMLDLDRADLPALDHQNGQPLTQFYTKKEVEMREALRIAHLILTFNEGAMALSSAFKGILASSIDGMNLLHDAATLYLHKAEFELSWLRVKSHFLGIYQPIIKQAHMHPLCIDLYEALANGHLKEFRSILEEVESLMEIRRNFVIFGNFIDQMGELIPIFTTSVMSELDFETGLVPDFKEAIDQAKLKGLFEQLQTYESALLDPGIEYLGAYLLKLQHEAIEKESWDMRPQMSYDVVLETVNLLDEEATLTPQVIDNLLSTFNVLFMPLAQRSLIKNFTPDLFDLVIVTDASSANILHITELMHAHKAILFGKQVDEVVMPLTLRSGDFQKLANKHSGTLQHFGEQYFEASLFTLVANSAAWDAQVKLPKQATRVLVDHIGEDIKSGAKKCETPIEDEIFETLVKIGYEVKCKIKVGNIMLDFLVIGASCALAINVVGDAPLQREVIKNQVQQEMELRRQGLNIRTVDAAHFYLNSRQALMDLCASLEQLEIYPLKR